MNRLKNFFGDYLVKRILSPTIIFSLLLILLSTCPGWGATYYVKNGGNDSLAGTSDATAWATIAKVQSTVRSGDTVYFRSQDTWTGADPLLNAVTGVTYDGSTYGSGTRATLRATSRVRGYGVVQIYVSNVTFKGFKVDSNYLSIGGIYIGGTSPTPSGDISNITVDNCEVTNGITSDNPDPSYYYAILVGARGTSTTSNVTVKNCIVHDVGHEGIAVYPHWGATAPNRVNGALIRNNIIYNTGQVPSNRHKPLSITNDSDNITMEFNTVYNCPAGIGVANYGPGYTGPDEYPNNFIIRYNLIDLGGVGTSAFVTNGYFGFPHFYGDGAFYGNILINSKINLGGLDYHSGSIKIYNNTVYVPTTVSPPIYMIPNCSNTSGIEIKNNILVTGSQIYPIKDLDGCLTNHSNNLIYTTRVNEVVLTTARTYKMSDLEDWEPTIQKTNPNFTGGTLPTGFSGNYGESMVPNTNYFLPQVGSPAIDNGTALGSPYDGCINGAGLATPIIRPRGIAYDIGAYEYFKPPAKPAEVIIVK